MRVIVLTSSQQGTASYIIPRIKDIPTIEIALVIYNKGIIRDQLKHYFKKLKKVFRIGILGAINGLRIRKWYSKDMIDLLKIESLIKVCADSEIPYAEVTAINSERTIQLLKDVKPD